MSAKNLTAITALSPIFKAAALNAIKVSSNAYAPYSEFHVGACFVHPDNSLTTGCNYENCTFQGTCAERCCMVKSNSEGKRAAIAVAIFGASANPKVKPMPADAFCPPCGLCRQHLNEVAELSNCDLQLILVTGDRKRVKLMKLSELLPHPFGPSHFGVDLGKYKPKINYVIQVIATPPEGKSSQKKAKKNDAASTKKIALKKK